MPYLLVLRCIIFMYFYMDYLFVSGCLDRVQIQFYYSVIYIVLVIDKFYLFSCCVSLQMYFQLVYSQYNTQYFRSSQRRLGQALQKNKDYYYYYYFYKTMINEDNSDIAKTAGLPDKSDSFQPNPNCWGKLSDQKRIICLRSNLDGSRNGVHLFRTVMESVPDQKTNGFVHFS